MRFWRWSKICRMTLGSNDAHFAAAFFAIQRVGFEHTADQVGPSSAKGFTLGGVELVVVERAFDGSQHVELAAL